MGIVLSKEGQKKRKSGYSGENKQEKWTFPSGKRAFPAWLSLP